jgi:RNA polymerase sigma factor (TIGR02999 family)
MDPRAPELDDLVTATYQELRRLAGEVGGRRGATLNPTALVNEAYLKLSSSLRVRPESPLHFKRIAARAMRQVLVEAARRRKTLKRGGDAAFVTLEPELDGADARGRGAEDVLLLDDALERLRTLDARQASVVEYRFFGGLEVKEVAELLGVSEATVMRDWRAARAWLGRELRPS